MDKFSEQLHFFLTVLNDGLDGFAWTLSDVVKGMEIADSLNLTILGKELFDTDEELTTAAPRGIEQLHSCGIVSFLDFQQVQTMAEEGAIAQVPNSFKDELFLFLNKPLSYLPKSVGEDQRTVMEWACVMMLVGDYRNYRRPADFLDMAQWIVSHKEQEMRNVLSRLRQRKGDLGLDSACWQKLMDNPHYACRH